MEYSTSRSLVRGLSVGIVIMAGEKKLSAAKLKGQDLVADGNIAGHLLPYPPKKTPPPFSTVDIAYAGKGAYFQVCAMCLEYKPPI